VSFATAARYPAKKTMGTGSSRAVLKNVKELREETYKRFDKQQLVLVGYAGAGKASLINTFNYATNRGNGPVAYQDITEKETKKTGSVSVTYRSYGPAHLFRSLNATVQQRRLQRACPRLFDVLGLTEKLLKSGFELKSLLCHLVNGEVTGLINVVSPFNSEQGLQKIQEQEVLNPRRRWSMVCVISLTDPFPNDLLERVAESCKAIAPLQRGVGLYVVLTKGDLLQKDLLWTRLEDYKKRCEKALTIPADHILVVQNYMSNEKEISKMSKTAFLRQKNILETLNQILKQSYLPVWTG
jgi:energy-coupling factor transporter ATP-binding protein EcfA2